MQPNRNRSALDSRPRIRATAAVLACLALSPTATADDPASKPAPPLARIEKFTADKRDHWAYQPLAGAEPPDVEEVGWVRNPIDQFVLADLESVELPHSPEADRVALIRRVTFDLTGLPPTPKAVADFLGDARPDAYERLVDDLLQSPQYGVRWAQHWLDLAHYADTNGFELDSERPDAWRYRDWVVDAFNTDMPYDRFIALQIAGDELEKGDASALIATGFGRSGPREIVGGNVIPAVKRQNELTEITGTVGSVFLGLTIGCARCHDHKFDAIPATDYYRLQSFFAASQLVDKQIAPKADVEAFSAAEKAIAEKLAPIRKELSALEAPYRKALAEKKQAMLTDEERVLLATPEKDRTPAQKKIIEGLQNSIRITWEDVAEAVAEGKVDFARREALKLQLHQIEQTRPRPPAHAMALVDDGPKAPDTFVYRRGDHKNLGPKVEPRPPGILLASQPKGSFSPDAVKADDKTTGRRAGLARWMADADNPLVARVIVNRLWQHHFTRGIVSTPSDFGVRGEPPSHPELLDWLAAKLIEEGWRLKPIHRLMVTSAVYRQSSAPVAKLTEMDDDNALLGRMNRRRLDAEGVRDAMLAVSGELNPKMGGPGVLAPLEKEVKDLIFTEAEVVDLWTVDPDPREHLRRSLYLFKKRNVRYPLLESFDAPDNQTACPRRETSTHALQALNLLNSETTIARARALAARILREAPSDPPARVKRAYEIALCRPPSPAETDRATAFLDAQRQADGEPAAWDDFALALLNCNEFLYVP